MKKTRVIAALKAQALADKEIVENENANEPSPWYFDYKIYEEANG
jgi:hypothetical protein